MAFTEQQRIEALLLRQVHWLQDIDYRLSVTNQLLKQLVDAQAPMPTYPAPTAVAVKVVP